ncbi:hypothetical protein PG637_09770 [Riemerella anatipestifer]|nr:hypothetical protein [Riemerella anatipestifer]MDY3325953.1 hypothetical protein [Riemerella anatipestifer]MDY3352340.1 hypothetical protein [Riemerella anatipestifer]MDY3352498.1 hypothetical protein [Riemerella anatipestifer]
MNDITHYIEKLIEATRFNKILWLKLRENIFVWQTETSENIRTNIILHKRKSTNKDIDILFRLFEVETKKILLDIDTSNTNEKNKKAIYNLFEVVENFSVNNELNILDDLTKKIK